MGCPGARRIECDTIYQVLVSAVLEVLGAVRELTGGSVPKKFCWCRSESVGGIVRLTKLSVCQGEIRADTDHVNADISPAHSVTDSSLV